MSYDVTGKVHKVEILTSSKGKPYATFEVKDDNDRIIPFSVFGDMFSKGRNLKIGQEVVIKGEVSSREYTDKSGKIRHGIDLRVQWIEQIEAQKKTVKQEAVPTDLDDLPF